MATFAEYEILEELYRGPLGSVLRGRLPGQARDFAIKVFDPAMMGLLEADSATQAFLDRSALQKSMVERGAGYWDQGVRPAKEGPARGRLGDAGVPRPLGVEEVEGRARRGFRGPPARTDRHAGGGLLRRGLLPAHRPEARRGERSTGRQSA